MSDRSADGLRACVASIRSVLAPCIADSGNALAMEQIALVEKYLGFLADRVDHIHAAAVFELTEFLAAGEGIASVLGDATADTDLAAALYTATATRDRSGAATPEVEAACEMLQAAISRIVRTVGQAGHPARAEIDRLSLVHGRRVLALRRGWFAAQGWESNAPDLDAVMGGQRSYGDSGEAA
jgi:hypothetical protein